MRQADPHLSPMNQAPRCHARTRRGTPCQSAGGEREELAAGCTAALRAAAASRATATP